MVAGDAGDVSLLLEMKMKPAAGVNGERCWRFTSASLLRQMRSRGCGDSLSNWQCAASW
jgi:hypothetical protein